MSRSAIAAVFRLAGRSTALTRVSWRSFLYDFVKPVTAPPMGLVAPAASYPWYPPSRTAETRKGWRPTSDASSCRGS